MDTLSTEISHCSRVIDSLQHKVCSSEYFPVFYSLCFLMMLFWMVSIKCIADIIYAFWMFTFVSSLPEVRI